MNYIKYVSITEKKFWDIPGSWYEVLLRGIHWIITTVMMHKENQLLGVAVIAIYVPMSKITYRFGT